MSAGATQSESLCNMWAMREGFLNNKHIAASEKFQTRRDITFTSKLYDDCIVIFLKLPFWAFIEAITILK